MMFVSLLWTAIVTMCTKMSSHANCANRGVPYCFRNISRSPATEFDFFRWTSFRDYDIVLHIVVYLFVVDIWICLTPSPQSRIDTDECENVRGFSCKTNRSQWKRKSMLITYLFMKSVAIINSLVQMYVIQRFLGFHPFGSMGRKSMELGRDSELTRESTTDRQDSTLSQSNNIQLTGWEL